MAKPDEKILERIRRLLAMAKDSSSPNEAAIAAGRAQKLMAQYNIENEQSILHDLENDDNLDRELVSTFTVNGDGTGRTRSVPGWASRLAVATARLFDCDVKITENWKNPALGVALTFYGYKTDVSVCRWTFDYLVEQVKRFNAQARKTYAGQPTMLSDYRKGLSSGMLEILSRAWKEKQRELNESKAGTSLIVVKKDAIVKKYGDFRYRTANVTLVNKNAYEHGKTDGRSVKLNKPLSTTPNVPRLK